MLTMGFSAWTLTLSILVTGSLASPVKIQLPSIPNIQNPFSSSQEINQNQQDTVVYTWIELDGRPLFMVAAAVDTQLAIRKKAIEPQLGYISQIYFQNDAGELRVWTQGKTQDIYIQVGEEKVRLMNVTIYDARLAGVSIEDRAQQIVQQIERSLKLAKEQRQPDYLRNQGLKAGGAVVLMVLITLAIRSTKRELNKSKEQQNSSDLAQSDLAESDRIWLQLKKWQRSNLLAVQRLLLDLGQIVIWVGGSIFILGLFPQTIWLQKLVITGLRIPARLGLVASATYVAIRLSYALIARFNSTLTTTSLVNRDANQRLQLRIATITGVTRGIITFTFSIVGVLVALNAVGVNIAPILAGAGIIGLAVSFASQNLIRDTINGFLIILEDQYAVGDAIKVGEYGGLVENINLRITQLRDAEGRLITIPNSEIRVVANLSSNWARADLNIPVAYNTDIDKALELITQVAEAMSQEEDWKSQIIEPPQVLGVDNFGERGAIVRVWIKTQPLQQWAVSREFRRRIKIAFDYAGIPIPMPQQRVWFSRHNSQSLMVEQSSKLTNT